jgi:hypothetical protein
LFCAPAQHIVDPLAAIIGIAPVGFFFAEKAAWPQAFWKGSKMQGSARLKSAPASGEQVEEENHHSDHEQKVNESARHMKGEPQEPQNQKNHKQCPKHTFSFVPRAH